MYIKVVLSIILSAVIPFCSYAQNESALAASMVNNLTVHNSKSVIIPGDNGVLNVYFEKTGSQNVSVHSMELIYNGIRSTFQIGTNIAITQNGRLVFAQKDDKVYIYDFTWFYSFFGFGSPGTKGAVEKINDKLSVVDLYGMYEGSNLTHTASGVTVRNVYSDGENVSSVEYIVNTQSMDEAYKIIRDYVYKNSESYAIDPENAEQYYPKTLDENEGTERINNDFVKTKLFIGIVDESTVYLLREGSQIKGYADIAEP